jgi:hypothetical protein
MARRDPFLRKIDRLKKSDLIIIHHTIVYGLAVGGPIGAGANDKERPPLTRLNTIEMS